MLELLRASLIVSAAAFGFLFVAYACWRLYRWLG
jgi:hypothetical protein